jgi:hypothetical protein
MRSDRHYQPNIAISSCHRDLHPAEQEPLGRGVTTMRVDELRDQRQIQPSVGEC